MKVQVRGKVLNGLSAGFWSEAKLLALAVDMTPARN